MARERTMISVGSLGQGNGSSGIRSMSIIRVMVYG